jgi:hypothetical protein
MSIGDMKVVQSDASSPEHISPADGAQTITAKIAPELLTLRVANLIVLTRPGKQAGALVAPHQIEVFVDGKTTVCKSLTIKLTPDNYPDVQIEYFP